MKILNQKLILSRKEEDFFLAQLKSTTRKAKKADANNADFYREKHKSKRDSLDEQIFHMKQLIGALTVQQVLTDQNIKVKDEQAEEEKEKGADNKTIQLRKDLKVVKMALDSAK